jgi:hypothetical protein
MENLLRWSIGFLVSLVIAHFATKNFLGALNSHLGYNEQWVRSNIDFNQPRIPAWLMGTLERLFFTILVAFDVSAVSAGIMGWLAIKMGTNWNRINPRRQKDSWIPSAGSTTTPEEHQQQQTAQQEAMLRMYALASLLGSLVSMLFALIGGLICSGRIWWWRH